MSANETAGSIKYLLYLLNSCQVLLYWVFSVQKYAVDWFTILY